MKKQIWLLLTLFSRLAFSQVVTWSPAFPTADDTITIVFDATQGNRQLIGVNQVYAHTGVITDQSPTPSSWLYVKTNWGENTAATMLQSQGNDQWQMKYHIRDYYGVPSDEKILKLAFVFRNSDGSRVGKTADNQDIFIPVYESGMNVVLLSPPFIPYFAEKNQNVRILAVAAHAAVLQLFQDNTLLRETEQDTLDYSFAAATPGKYSFKINAADGSGFNKEICFDIHINPDVTIQELPANTADGINYLSGCSVLLSLMAPLKSFAYVIGDFNDWQIDAAFMMKRTPDASHCWLQIDGLEAQREYRFQYLVDGHIRIADPYIEKILDPDNDPYIDAETYPNLLPYPEGKTTEIVGIMQLDAPSYDWQITEYQKPKATDLVIYELLLRDFLEKHDFKTLTDTLGYFQRLGVNAIEIMPFSEFEGNDSWGYNPSFYFAPDKYYGPKQDVQRFIDEAHRRGIAVIQDIVLNHAYGQCPLVRLYSDDMSHNPWFNAQSPNPVYSWGYDFNHESQATQDFVDRAFNFWQTEYHIDGFRLDFAKGFTNTRGDGSVYDAARIRILERIADRIWAVDSTAYVILELFAPNKEEKELAEYGFLLWGNMTGKYYEAAMGYNEGDKSDFTAASFKSKTRGWSKPGLVAYMESHDEERQMYKNLQYGNGSGDYQIQDLFTALQRIKLAAAFFYTIPGPKMLWQFGELGYEYSIDYNGRLGLKPIRWDYFAETKRRSLFNVCAALIKLRIEQPAFESTDFVLSVAGAMKSIHINHESMNVTIIGNFDVTTNSINPQFQAAGWWYDYLSGDSLLVIDTQSLITLNAGEYYIFTSVHLLRPDLSASVDADRNIVVNSMRLQQNYPNPFNASTMISYTLPVAGSVRLDIYNFWGQHVRKLVHGYQISGDHWQLWDGCDDQGLAVSSGLYICRCESAGCIQQCKMLLIR